MGFEGAACLLFVVWRTPGLLKAYSFRSLHLSALPFSARTDAARGKEVRVCAELHYLLPRTQP